MKRPAGRDAVKKPAAKVSPKSKPRAKPAPSKPKASPKSKPRAKQKSGKPSASSRPIEEARNLVVFCWFSVESLTDSDCQYLLSIVTIVTLVTS